MVYFILLFLSLYVSGEFLPLNQVSIGSNCGSTKVFDTIYFSVYPWPPKKSLPAVISMDGYFKQKVYVQQIVVGTCYNSMLWNYQPFPVDATFYPEEYMPFEIPYIYSNRTGSYITNVQLTAGDHISCWQFSYQLN